MKKKKTYAGFIFFLFLVEIAAGIWAAQRYLADAAAQKRILRPLEYRVLPVAAEDLPQDSTGSQSAEDLPQDSAGSQGAQETSAGETMNTQAQADSREASAVTCEVSHDRSLAAGAQVTVTAAGQSSVIEQEGHTNTAYQACDGDLSTSWQEGEDGPGLGSWLYYEFDGSHGIRTIVMYAGVWREAEGKDYYHENCRPKELGISIGDQTWQVSLDDNKEPQVIQFSETVQAENITFYILDVYEGSVYEDTGIAEITVYEG